MRIGGLASGIDTDTIIKDLMKAERMPLDKMEQDKIKFEWKRDAFRDINKQVAEIEKMITDMRLNSSMINAKTISSTMGNAVTATGSSSATNGSYEIAVTQLAKNAINVGTGKVGKDVDLSNYVDEEITFYTYGEAYTTEDGTEVAEGMQARTFTINEGDTLKDVLKKIESADKNVRAFYDEQTQQVVLETKRSGDYNTDSNKYGGKEIGFDDDSFFTNVLKMDLGEEQGGTNAKFIYNGVLELESKENRYTLNGITFEFKDTTGTVDNPQSAKLTVSNDVDTAVENITKLVTKYNELVESLNSSQQEQRYRDFPPLTNAQREEMSENEIELWEEKAKSGLLKGESIITSSLFDVRQGWYQTVENGSQFKLLTDIGLSTTKDYLDGGKLEINEGDLRTALTNDPESVQKLLLNNVEGEGRGLLNRLEDSLENTIGRIEKHAGKGSYTSEMYTIGRRMDDLDGRISAFEDKLTRIEDRYWRQFSAMEQAISRMNNQSAMLMNAFGGGTM